MLSEENSVYNKLIHRFRKNLLCIWQYVIRYGLKCYINLEGNTSEFSHQKLCARVTQTVVALAYSLGHERENGEQGIFKGSIRYVMVMFVTGRPTVMN